MGSIDGLVSGIDTTTIVQGLLQFQQKAIDRLNSRIGEVTTKQTAFKGVEATLFSLQGSLSQLSRVSGNVFNSKTVTSSNESLIAAAASDKAEAGVYTLKVNTLARAHQIASQGFADAESLISEGTISLQIGNGAVSTITIDSTNNTLQGLADAINGSGLGVGANVINDGSGGSSPYRLLLTSSKAGSANAIKLTNNLAASSGSTTRPVLQDSFIENAVKGTFAGTASVASNSGASTYTGSASDTYSFTVTQGGTVGTDSIQISYADGSGENTGSITVNSTDTLVAVAEGLQVSLGAGTIVAGDTFSVAVQSPATAVQAATDASITFGSGAGALTIQSETNQIEDVIPGVTLDLLGADTSKEVSLTVANDIESARTAITDFVDAFNTVISGIDQTVNYDSESGVAGVLLGNRSVVAIQDQIRNEVIESVSGISGQLNRLTSIGITFNSQGALTVNSSRLDDVLNGRVEGVSIDDVRRLFALDGTSTNPGVRFVLGSTRTKEFTTGLQVDITQAAEHAAITAGSTITDSTVISAANNTLSLTLDGQISSTLTLADGTYTRAELASHIESVINSDTELGVREVRVSIDNNALKITSQSYGSSSEVKSVSGTAAATLGFSGQELSKGIDVIGKFLVNGVEETATGNGQLLVGDSNNESTADLQIVVTLTSSQVQAGADADLTVSRGVASKLDQTLTSILDPVNGRVATANDGFDDEIAAIQATIDRQNELFELRQQSLIEQFIALESAISEFQNTGNFLAAQLASVNGLSNG